MVGAMEYQRGRRMRGISATSLILIFGLCASGSALAQHVYKCTDADGAITFSQLPCESDIGDETTVDATPHQGHRAGPPPGTPAYTMPAPAPEESNSNMYTSGARTGNSQDPLDPGVRSSLENDRKSALSNLRKRHLSPAERSRYREQLQEADRQLGRTQADVASSPEYDRRVYNRINRASRNRPAQSASSHTTNSSFQPSSAQEERKRMIIDHANGETFNRLHGDRYINSSTGEAWEERRGYLHNLENDEKRKTPP